jgi:Ca-activated chloride channel family protein
MSQHPALNFRSLRPAVASDQSSTLDLLLTIATPQQRTEEQKCRPPLNLALVIDRSGSMRGRKLSQARKAARFLAGELTAQDRLAIITFDSTVQVLVPSQSATDPQRFIAAINTIHSGSCTALFDGWLAGATQVAEHLSPSAFNRVLLLSDGQANEGLTDQQQIAAKVAGLTARGISTSAFGLGNGFDEDLMGAMATAGDGTLALIESPDQLADLYASELQGLASTVGRKVSLGITAQNGTDVLNDLPTTITGNYLLPNLRAGQELSVGVRLRLPAWAPNQEIARVRLSWDGEVPERQELVQALTLPVKSLAELQAMDADPAVAEQFALLEANRRRRQAIEQLDRGDVDGAEKTLDEALELFESLPASQLAQSEKQRLLERKGHLHQDRNISRKRLTREAMRSSTHVWEGKGDGA